MKPHVKNQNVIPIKGKALRRVERAATAASREAKEVERLPFDLSALEEEGVFINVDARGFGMLNRRLDWQALGIRLPEGTDVSFSGGRICDWRKSATTRINRHMFLRPTT